MSDHRIMQRRELLSPLGTRGTPPSWCYKTATHSLSFTVPDQSSYTPSLAHDGLFHEDVRMLLTSCINLIHLASDLSMQSHGLRTRISSLPSRLRKTIKITRNLIQIPIKNLSVVLQPMGVFETSRDGVQLRWEVLLVLEKFPKMFPVCALHVSFESTEPVAGKKCDET